MSSIIATYDGKAFVPKQPVQLAVGTEVEVVIAHPRQPTDEERSQWQEILQELSVTTPAYPTVDEAMQKTRKRP